MINLDSKYQHEKQQEITENKSIKKGQVDVQQSIFSALSQMKQNINKNQHLQENLRKHLLTSTSNVSNHKFEIEQIYSKDNMKSQLKHAIPLQSLNQQRRKIKNTMKTFNLNTHYDFSQEEPINIYQISPNKTKLNTQPFFSPPSSVMRGQESPNPAKLSLTTAIPSHPSSAKANKRQSNFFLTNPSNLNGKILLNSFKMKTKDKLKTQISYTSETQCGSHVSSSRLITTQNNQNSQHMITVNHDKFLSDTTAQMSPPLLSYSASAAAMTGFSLKLNQGVQKDNNSLHFQTNTLSPQLHHQLHTDQENISILSGKNTQNSSSNIFNFSQTAKNRSKLFKSISGTSTQFNQLFKPRISESLDKPILRASSANPHQKTFETIPCDEEIMNLNKFSQEMNEQDVEEDKSPIISIPEINMKDAVEEGEKDDTFIAEPKQLYYINNNEMQSVKEFMYRMQKYQQYKRFEQQRLEKKQRKNQIQDVQELLLFRSEKAAREVAKANVRKYIMKHKIQISDQEVDDLVEQIKVLPVEQNQRLTFRECNRQIISLQLQGNDEEKQFFKIQREIDKALNKINRPVKFAHQFQIYLNNKKKYFQSENMTKNQVSMAIINSLPSQYLINKPPPSFFMQNSQSMNKIGSIRSIKLKDSHHTLNHMQSKVSQIIEAENLEES